MTSGSAGSAVTNVPGTVTTQCTAYSTEQGCIAAQSTTSGAYSYAKPWATFSAQLIARPTPGATPVPVWAATANSGGNAFAGASTLVRSVVGKTVSQLIADGIISKGHANTPWRLPLDASS